MPSVLSYTNSFPGIPFPNHLSGQSQPQSYIYPGAVQPQKKTLTVLSYANAFPGIAFPQKISGNTNTVQNYLFPGAAQPSVASAAATFPSSFGISIFRLKPQRWKH
jgi:hypothetical protein